MFYLNFVRKLLLVAVIGLLTLLATSGRSHAESNSQERNDLDALWNYYNYTYIQNGRVIALDENSITTSEGQSYAMLRAVWSGDRQSFDSIWSWT